MADKTKESPSPFCYYPFTQLLLQPTGAVSPCCWIQGREQELGRVPGQSLEEIWNGEPIRKLRKEFLDGKPVTCSKQIRYRNCHLGSHREFSAGLEPKEVMSSAPVRLDLRLNGQCNLKCVMCGIWEQPNHVYDTSDFWTYGPEKIFPYLREIELLGGEPLIQRDTYRLIDEVSAVNERCEWRIATNGHYNLTDSILESLDKIRIDRIHVSLDSLQPETYRRIRRGGDLEKVMRTLLTFEKYREKRKSEGREFSMAVSLCVQKMNWEEVGDFLNFCVAKGYLAYFQFCFHPGEESLISLPPVEKEKVLAYFFKLLSTYGPVMRPLIVPLSDSLELPGGGEV